MNASLKVLQEAGAITDPKIVPKLRVYRKMENFICMQDYADYQSKFDTIVQLYKDYQASHSLLGEIVASNMPLFKEWKKAIQSNKGKVHEAFCERD